MSGSGAATHWQAFQSGLDEVVLATDRLLATIDGMHDTDLREPSLLPRWTRAHVLTHVARNADALINLVRWARTGREAPMYPAGRAARDADIEAGANRHIGDVRLDVNESAERLLDAFADFAGEALERHVRFSSGTVTQGWELPLFRMREVEIHHVDLGMSYTAAHWPPTFVARTLDQLAPVFLRDRQCPIGLLSATDTAGRWRVAARGPTLSGPQHALLAWLTGRSDGQELHLDVPGDIPPAPTWS